MRTESMLETTWSNAIRSPSAVSTPRARPFSTLIRVTSTPVRTRTPRLSASRRSAAGTARVPPLGYQTPSPTCMWAMPQSTAGDAAGEEPTYWMKCSSICATRASLTEARTCPATLRCIRSASTSRSVATDICPSIVSFRSSTAFQKKNRSEMPASRSETLRKSR